MLSGHGRKRFRGYQGNDEPSFPDSQGVHLA